MPNNIYFKFVKFEKDAFIILNNNLIKYYWSNILIKNDKVLVLEKRLNSINLLAKRNKRQISRN